MLCAQRGQAVRIIAGSARGKRLLSAPNPALRPMLDRVKESLFNILRHLVPGSRVLDLFAGSGAIGLEALSRGADHCVFVESDPQLLRLARLNVERCRLLDRCETLLADALTLPHRMPPARGVPAGLVFVDPPYAMVDDPNARATLFVALERMIGAWVSSDAVLVLHHRPLPHALWPTCRLTEWDKRTYGRSQLTFFDVVEGHDGPNGPATA